MDALAAAKPARTPNPRTVRRIVLALCALGALGLIVFVATIVCGWLHYRATPRFDEYLATHTADASRIVALPAEAVVLAEDRDWVLGERDIDEAADKNGGAIHFELRRSDVVLLELEQSFVWSLAPAAPDSAALAPGRPRDGFRLRTEQLRCADDVHAEVVVYVEGAERLVGPESARTGALTFDVWILGGQGPSRVRFVSVPRRPDAHCEPLPGERRGFSELLARAAPWSTVPEEGLIHRITQTVHLTAQRTAGGAESNGHGGVEFSSNTAEYSYEVEVKLNELDRGMSSSATRRVALAFNGREW